MIEKVELTKADVENASCSVVKRFNKPKVYFSNEEEGDRIYGIYKCLLSQKKVFYFFFFVLSLSNSVHINRQIYSAFEKFTLRC